MITEDKAREYLGALLVSHTCGFDDERLARAVDVVYSRLVKDPPDTLRVVAARWRFSPERVRQIEAKGIRTLRNPARRRWVGLFFDTRLPKAVLWDDPVPDVPDESMPDFSILQGRPPDPLEPLDIRVRRALRRKGYDSIDAVKGATDEELLQIVNFGKKALKNVRDTFGYPASPYTVYARSKPRPVFAVR